MLFAMALLGGLLAGAASAPDWLVPRSFLADSQAVEAGLAKDVRLFELLVDMGLLQLEMRPADAVRRQELTDPWSGYVLSTRRVDGQGLPSSVTVPPEVVSSGVPVASLAFAPSALERLWKYPRLRGKQSEVPAFVSVFRDGRLTLASPVRVRLHGNTSRRKPRKSYRVYFPESSAASTDALGWGGAEAPIDKVILSSDEIMGSNLVAWHFSNALALDIAARIGCITPRTAPTLFYLDGAPQGAYVFTERIDESFFERREMAELSWHSVRDAGRADPSSFSDYQALWTWLESAEPLDYREVEARFDLDNLSRWYLSVLYSSTKDAFQGIAARFEEAEPRRWFWVNWDMDLSYFSPHRGSTRPGGGGERRSIEDLTWDRWGDPRALLLQRLLAESPEYRRRLGDVFLEVWNYRVTPEFLRQRVAHYAEVARLLGVYEVEYFGGLEYFFDHRLPFLGRHLQSHLAMRLAAVRLISPEPGRISIDGHVVSSEFVGSYRRGSRVTVEIETCRGGFSHWRVNGKVRRSGRPKLVRRVGERNRIEAVFDGPCESVVAQADEQGT